MTIQSATDEQEIIPSEEVRLPAEILAGLPGPDPRVLFLTGDPKEPLVHQPRQTQTVHSITCTCNATFSGNEPDPELAIAIAEASYNAHACGRNAMIAGKPNE